MFCPNCGKDCEDSKFCPECGQKLSVEQTIMEPPVGRYEAVDGYMDVSYHTMTIHKETDSQTAEYIIDYTDIMDVTFCCASNAANGYLAIREITDQLPPVEDEWDAVCDEKTLCFGTDRNQAFSRLHAFLNHCKTASQARLEEERAARICCPKCKSNRYYVCERSYHRPFVRGKSIVLAIMMCIMYLCHRFGAKRVEYVCLECGHRWNP